MTQINFLPASFARNRIRQRRSMWLSALLVFCAIGLTLACLTQRRRVERMGDHRGALVEKLAGVRQRAKSLEDLHARQAALIRDLRTQQELLQPLSHTSAMAILSDVVPASVAASKLSLTLERATKKTTSGGKKKKKKKANAGLAPPWSAMRIDLEGLAPSGREIAEMVGALEGHPAFGSIKLSASRPVEIGHVRARAFRMKLSIPLDCEYRSPDGGSPRAALAGVRPETTDGP